MLTLRYAGIGSREAPEDDLRLQRTMAWVLADLGYALYSGGCPKGSDKAHLEGAYRHRPSDKSRNRIYLSWNGMSDLYHDPDNGFYDPQRFDNYDEAGRIGLAARGSWNGLGWKGIAHMTRNVYQVLGDDLASPVDFVLCSAIPQGKKGHVKGGTGQAVRLAIQHNIPVFNLQVPVVKSRIMSFCLHLRLKKLGY